MRYEYKKVESTNLIANELAAAGAAHGTAVIAEEQTAGQGRRGRKFFSPPGTGIYMSIVLDSAIVSQNPAFITVHAAVAVCKAIETVCGKNPGIKWVNDLFLNGKKICGISAEAFLDASRLVVGIGINLVLPDLPSELKPIVGAVFEESPPKGTRERLIDEVLRRMQEPLPSADRVIREYRQRLFVIGKTVRVENAEPYEARVLDVNSEGHLVVENKEGQQIVLFAGEVSIVRLG